MVSLFLTIVTQKMNPAGSPIRPRISNPAPIRPSFLKRNLVKAMERRRSQFKSTTTRSVPYTRPAKYTRVVAAARRRRPARTRPAGGNLSIIDPTVTKLNMFRLPSTTVVKTLRNVFGISAGTPAAAWSFIFDPSGDYAKYSGTSNGYLGQGGVLTPMPDWASFASIYNQYKVKKIIITWRFETTGATVSTLDDDSVGILERYNYEKSIVLPTANGLAQLTDCIRKRFTAQNPSHQYTIYPKVCYEVQNSAIVSPQGVNYRSPGWCDVNYPVQIYGYQFAMETPTNAYTQGYCDITYEVDFRYSK